MDSGSKRFFLFQERMNADKDSFLFDIQLWRDALPKGTSIQHHVAQFYALCEKSLSCFDEEYEKKSPHTAQDKRIVFRSSVVGALHAQWGALRQVAAQRLPGHPYQARIGELDQIAEKYYQQLCSALPEETRKCISVSAPLTYLGNSANLTLIHPNMPSLLGVPFGAADIQNAVSKRLNEHTIPHEIAHAILSQIPHFDFDLEAKACGLIRQNRETPPPNGPQPSSLPDNQRRILHGTFRKWLTEISADLVGTALGGDEFVRSAIQIMIAPDEAVTVGENDHPLAIIRPYIHYEVLRLTLNDAKKLKEIKDELDRVSGNYIERFFDTGNSLTIIPISDTRDELSWVVQQLFTVQLDSLGDTLGGFLKKCSQASATDWLPSLPEWGALECDGTVLQLLKPLGPQHSTPFTFPYEMCCKFGFKICC